MIFLQVNLNKGGNMVSLAFTLGRVTQYVLTDPLVRKILVSVIVIILNAKK